MRSKTQLFCLGTFNSHAEIRLVEGLLNPQVGRTGNVPHFREQVVCVDMISLQVVSDNLNVDRSGQAKIENLADHVSRQKSEGNTRKLFRQFQPELVNVVIGGTMLGRERYKNVCVRRAHGCRVAVGKINAAIRQTNVVDDALDLRRRNLLPNRPLDQVAKVGGFFNAHYRGSTHMKLESAAVNAGEEVPAEPGNQNG